MSLNIDLAKIHPSNGLIILKIITSGFLGFLSLYFLNRQLFFDLDVFRLCVLVMPLPIVLSFFFGFCIFFTTINEKMKLEFIIQSSILFGSFMADISLLLMLFSVRKFGIDPYFFLVFICVASLIPSVIMMNKPTNKSENKAGQ